MNNEEKILAVLELMNDRLSALETDLNDFKAEMSDFRSETNEHFERLEASLNYAWEDIALGEERIKQHEKEFHKVG